MKYPQLLTIFRALYFSTSSSSLAILSSCRADHDDHWNTSPATLGVAAKSWLQSIVTVRAEGEGDSGSIQSMLYQPNTGEFTEHFAHYNDQMEGSHDVDTDRKLVTIGTFVRNIPTGLTWQWRSKRMAEGFLYGEVDRRGQFTNGEVVFVYPDFLTGLRGKFLHGVLVDATAVDIVGERCKGGIKEILVEPIARDADVKWERMEANHWFIGQHPQVTDPYEKKSVYVKRSLIPGSEEGLFARRAFLPGDIVSYFAGTKTFERNMFFDNMT